MEIIVHGCIPQLTIPGNHQSDKSIYMEIHCDNGTHKIRTIMRTYPCESVELTDEEIDKLSGDIMTVGLDDNHNIKLTYGMIVNRLLLMFRDIRDAVHTQSHFRDIRELDSVDDIKTVLDLLS